MGIEHASSSKLVISVVMILFAMFPLSIWRSYFRKAKKALDEDFAYMRCQSCGKMVPQKAFTCPHCLKSVGVDADYMNEKFRRIVRITLISSFILVFAFFPIGFAIFAWIL